MPLLCPSGFATCGTSWNNRQRYRKANTDDGSPGYFALTIDNEIKMEATATRRAGLERFTFPEGAKPYFLIDLANDLTQSFAGGEMDIDAEKGRVTVGGWYGSRWAEPKYFIPPQLTQSTSFGPGSFNYQTFACYDLLNGGNQTLDEYGVWTANK